MDKKLRPVVVWLLVICLMVIMMVVVGGVTRLTHSGLSMVDWKPIVGIIPPIGETEWLTTFAKYKQFPQYKLVNTGMSLSDFKAIFFWEYMHRVLGRLIGMVFFFPWIVFLFQKRLSKKLNRKCMGLFFLGGLQGLMGWYMVMSGLVNDPSVSHYRLAAHLSLALLILVCGAWLIFDISLVNKNTSKQSKLRRLVVSLFTLTIIQIIWGAFVAGLKAGFQFNTFPKMNGDWIPVVAFDKTPMVLNFLENTAGVQFVHRVIGWVLFFGVISFYVYSQKFRLSKNQKVGNVLLLGMVLIQFTLGVMTLVMGVPVFMGALHQLGAAVLLVIITFVLHSYSNNAERT